MLLSSQKLLLCARVGSTVVQTLLLQCSTPWPQCSPVAASGGLTHSSSSNSLASAFAAYARTMHSSSSSSRFLDPWLLDPWLLVWCSQQQRWTVGAAAASDSSAANSWSSGGCSRCISSTARAIGPSRPGGSSNSGSSRGSSTETSGSKGLLDSSWLDSGSRGGGSRGSSRGENTHRSSNQQGSRKRGLMRDAGHGGEADEGGSSSKRPRTSIGELRSTGQDKGPAWIRHLITKQCSTVQQLQQLVDWHGPKMNAINISAAICKLPKLHSAQGSSQQLGQHQQDKLQLLGQLWLLLQPKLLACDQRGLANIIWASSKLQSKNMQLYEACMQQYQKGADGDKPQHLANVVYALCTAPAAIRQQHLAAVQQQLVPAFITKLPSANPQTISNVLYAVAASGLQLQAGQLQQLLTAIVCMRQEAKPQEVSNTLWAVATMGQPVPEWQLQQLLDAFVGMMQLTKPQEVSNTLWAVATMGQPVPDFFFTGQLPLLLDRFACTLMQATPQAFANTLWPCAKLGWLPHQLLAAPQLTAMLPQANAQDLGNIAWACGELGHADEQLMGALLEQAVQRLEGGGSNHVLDAQSVCNICWSVAVLNLQQCSHQLLPLMRACSQQLWDSVVAAELRQLQQVHTWLLDFGLAGGNGLQGSLTAAQLQQCRAAWDVQMAQTAQAAAASTFHCLVFAALQQLPIAWQQPPRMEQVSLGRDGQPDGALLVDIVGRTASGQLVAVEADGPFHFRRPDGGLKGPTLYRNRALEVRGYIVVGVPKSKWDEVWQSKAQQRQYMQQLLAEAGVV